MGIMSPFLKQTVATIYDFSINGYGDATYTATLQSLDGYSVGCRFVVTPSYVYSKEGVAEIAKAQAWFNPDVVIDEGYKVAYGGNTYEVISVDSKRNLMGIIEFKKVLLR